MTSEAQVMKTNEFLRRRKLRLQQVREQSKDIAKKIRQRANSENIRQIVDLDEKKQKEYFERQEKLVKRLEALYAKGLKNVGLGHHTAIDVTQQDVEINRDLSKVRAKEAAAALQKERQEKLDEKKKLLDRKLQAREAANEISREKLSVVASKVLAKTTNSNDKALNATSTVNVIQKHNKDSENNKDGPVLINKNSIGIQWDAETMSQECEPAASISPLPVADQDNLKDLEQEGNKSEKNNRLDLFAISKEMPLDLRGSQVDVPEINYKIRPSLTLVTEYLQSRKLRLRETEPTHTIKNKQSDDISRLKQTIIHTRASKIEGTTFNLCQVLEEQAVPVPSWHAERNCDHCMCNISPYKKSAQGKQFKNMTNSQYNRFFCSLRPIRQCDPVPRPVLRSTSPFTRNKINQRFCLGGASTSTHNLKPESMLNRKKSVLVYNHCTKDARDVPQSEEQLVVRELQSTEDAYTQAIMEGSTAHDTDKEHLTKNQDVRSRIAVTKQSVEKEYKDTINFLNSIPKRTNVVKTAYMDERQQHVQNENRQRKMEQEYKKIEKECRKHHSCMNQSHNKSRSPSKQTKSSDVFDSRDYQYSWMPVPEGDGNLAVHTIPNGVKESKNSNGVQFSKVDSYHEYRSRHKHTPPTKDTAGHEKRCNKKHFKAVIIDKNGSTAESSMTSESSSVEDLPVSSNRKVKNSDNLSDAERIIIYKILDTKNNKHSKEKNKLLSDIAKSLTSIEKVQKSGIEEQRNSGPSKKVHNQADQIVNRDADDSEKFEQIEEGLYKVNEGQGNNLSSMHYHAEAKESVVEETSKGICENENARAAQKRCKGPFLQWQEGVNPQIPREKSSTKTTKCDPAPAPASAATSTSSFKTATNDKACSPSAEGGFIKLLDETGHEAAKFFLGGTTLLKDDAYEVVIQLRKKEAKESLIKEIPKQTFNENLSTEKVRSNNFVKESVPSEGNVQTNSSDDREIVEMLSVRSFPEKELKSISPRISNQATKGKSILHQVTSCQNNQGSESCADIRLVNSCYKKKDVADKGTPLQHDLSANHYEPASRPATTTYTQTTNSPMQRPIYLHLSSSTSTAYMSPPEIILPKFFKYDSDGTDIETLDLSGKHISEKFIKKQRYPKRNSSKHKVNNVYDGCKQIATPPDTVRSCEKHKHSSSDHLPYRHKVLTSCKIARLDKNKCRCHNCGVNILSRNNCRNQGHRGYNTAETCHTRRKIVSSNVTSNNKHKSAKFHSVNKNSNSSLNPIIKNYINNLLSLNRKGLKALEVAGQDCSSVATPSSSIINVPYNIINERNGSVENIISLEHIKKVLMQQAVDANFGKKYNNINKKSHDNIGKKTSQSRRKVLHKVKSLNISKHLITKPPTEKLNPKKVKSAKLSKINSGSSNLDRTQLRPCNSPTLRQSQTQGFLSTYKDDKVKKTSNLDMKQNNSPKMPTKVTSSKHLTKEHRTQHPIHKATATDTSPDPTRELDDNYRSQTDISVDMPTQTGQNIDCDLMKLAENKLNNMEKIADLTEKCTKRLSNLARVLEEVRKNKSLVYSHMSGSDSTDSQSDHKADKVVQSPVSPENIAIPNTLGIKSLEKIQLQIKSPEISQLEAKNLEFHSENNNVPENEKDETHSEFMSFLINIPKPTMSQLTEKKEITPKTSDPISAISPLTTDSSSTEFIKFRPKPPAALSRLNLKHGQELIVPHELSTVLEIDSPMSVKNKNLSSRHTSSRSSTEDKETLKASQKTEVLKHRTDSYNPDLLQGNKEVSKHLKHSSNESSDDSKFQMIDLKHFNDIMLEPFLTVHEYAKKYNVTAPDEGSNFEDIQKDDAVNDDISSFRSDGSLPDVIAELLKRNVITEPFKFETASNVNSTTVSSESTLSMLALSKARKSRKKPNLTLQNKENIGETTDSLSISSNPDLENAFKKLGMGWASSTLKKTKERLALSSSSNTSSSSLSQFKIKSFNRDIPALVTDSVSSVLFSQKELHSKSILEHSKNGKKQTNITNSMTVKEFLAKELANKITFTSNKSDINNTEEEFVSLFETKMPEGLKQQTQLNCDGLSNESIPSGGNRARTSTPVQLLKSTTNQSSSCSNVSNGLFSNADLSSVKITSNSMKNHSTTDKDDLTIPNFSLKLKNSDCSKSD